jgi:hypothetical protein
VFGCSSARPGVQRHPVPDAPQSSKYVMVSFKRGFCCEPSRGWWVLKFSQNTTFGEAIAGAGGIPSGIVDFEIFKALPPFGIYLQRGGVERHIGKVPDDVDRVPIFNENAPKFVEDGDVISLAAYEGGIERARQRMNQVNPRADQ